ncbi:MAG: hypothetical protein ACR2O2_16795 [Ruegeria sp.]
MKPLLPLVLLFFYACCTEIPQLEGDDAAAITNARYPKLIPLEEALGPPVNPEDEAAIVEEELDARSKSLDQKAKALQSAPVS